MFGKINKLLMDSGQIRGQCSQEVTRAAFQLKCCKELRIVVSRGKEESVCVCVWGGGQELDRMKREQLYRCYLLGVGGR